MKLELFTLRSIPPLWVKILLGFSCIGLILLIWTLVTRGEAEFRTVSPAVLPSPGETFSEFGRVYERDLVASIAASLKRVFVGFWDPDPVCVAVQRPQTLSHHPGEVSFPGGRPEPGEDLLQTALREAREELGITPVRLLGRLSSRPVYTSHFRLEPWVAQVPGYPTDANPGEVARVVEKHPERFVNWVFVNPNVEDAAHEAEVWMARPGAIGVKAHPFWHC